jgi:hypothetical protein
MERGKLYNLIRGPGNGDAARLIGGKTAAINHFSRFRHGDSSISKKSEFQKIRRQILARHGRQFNRGKHLRRGGFV